MQTVGRQRALDDRPPVAAEELQAARLPAIGLALFDGKTVAPVFVVQLEAAAWRARRDACQGAVVVADDAGHVAQGRQRPHDAGPLRLQAARLQRRLAGGEQAAVGRDEFTFGGAMLGRQPGQRFKHTVMRHGLILS